MLSVVIPTYNERENIVRLLEEIDFSLKGLDYEVVVIDDDSPDETWKRVEEVEDSFPVEVVRRRGERGLSTAVLRGIEEANGSVIVVMDADFQHPPDKIPDLFYEIEGGADIAVGSRYVSGGETGDFGFFRSIISKGADFLARVLFEKVRDIEDIQSGFFALRKEVLKDTELDPRGYKILLEILVQADYDEVSEVGYEFGDRKSGESKLGITSVVDYLKHVWSLSRRSGEIARFIKFCSVGGSGALVNLSFTYFFTSLGLWYLFSGIIAREAALTFNFFLNKAWTFEDRNVSGLKDTIGAFGRAHVVRSGGYS